MITDEQINKYRNRKAEDWSAKISRTYLNGSDEPTGDPVPVIDQDMYDSYKKGFDDALAFGEIIGMINLCKLNAEAGRYEESKLNELLEEK